MRLAVFTKNRTNPAYGAARLGAERAAQALGGAAVLLVGVLGNLDAGLQVLDHLNRLGGEWYSAAQLGGSSFLRTQWYQPLEATRHLFVDAGYTFTDDGYPLYVESTELLREAEEVTAPVWLSGVRAGRPRSRAAGGRPPPPAPAPRGGRAARSARRRPRRPRRRSRPSRAGARWSPRSGRG